MAEPTWQRTHDPDADLPYGINWTAWLAGDTIATSTWTVSGSGVTLHDDDNTTTATTVWAAGGTEGTKYDLTNHIVTTAGLEDDRTIVLVCASR